MKSIFFAMLFCLLGVGALQAQNGGDNALVGRARGALGPCYGQAQQGAPGPILSRVDVTGSCFAGGFIQRVTFYYIIFGPICDPVLDPDCRPALPLYQQVGTVDFDCAGNVIGTNCSN